MNQILEADLLAAAREYTVVAKHTLTVAENGSDDYRIGAIVGLCQVDLLPDGIELDDNGDYRVPIDRAVVVDLPMPSHGRLPAGVMSERISEGLRTPYDSKISLPNMMLGREAIAEHVARLMHDTVYRQPGSKWQISVIGQAAFGFLHRSLGLAGNVPNLEDTSFTARMTQKGTHEQERANNLYATSVLAHERLYQLAPSHEEALISPAS